MNQRGLPVTSPTLIVRSSVSGLARLGCRGKTARDQGRLGVNNFDLP